MQFYIIHKDPKINAELLPDYCLKRVNIREGWQMLSDIGHLFNVTWEHQNKVYNPYHAETRQYWKNAEAYSLFINHYEACLIEYKKRYNKHTVFYEYYYNYRHTSACKLFRKIYYQKQNQIIKYLLDKKIKHLSKKEIDTLRSLTNVKHVNK